MNSQKFRSTFVHIPKFAGQSVETALLEAYGLTLQSRAELLFRSKEERNAGPQRLVYQYTKEYVERDHVPSEIFDAYFSFAVIRYFCRRITKYKTRHKWCLSGSCAVLNEVGEDELPDSNRRIRPQANLVAEPNAEIIVDEIVRFGGGRTRRPDLLTEQTDSPTRLPCVNRLKPVLRIKQIPRQHRDRVREMYSADFELFGFDGGTS